MTDELERLAGTLRAAAEQCGEAAVRIPGLRSGDSVARDADLHDVERALRGSQDRLAQLARALTIAAELYEQGERAAAAGIEVLAAQLAAAAGFIAARLGLLLLPGILDAAARTAAVWNLLPGAVRESIAGSVVQGLRTASSTLGDPRSIEAIRVALSLVDDAALGAAGVPPVLVSALGESGLGVSGIDTAAIAVLGLASLAGGSGVDPVRIDRVGADLRRGGESRAVEPPAGLADRVSRIPDPAAPVVVERYRLPDGSEHLEVYIAGTDPAASLGGDRPWDMASNIALIAGQQASSLQAARAALAAAGATAETSVTFTGYSQGGAIATALAESGDYRTTGLVTVGAPTGGLPVRGEYPAVVIEHRDDLVPVLSGLRRETSAVVVRGDAFEASESPGAGLPAHGFDRYLATAALADAHESPALRAAVAELPRPAVAGERSAFTATRIQRSATD